MEKKFPFKFFAGVFFVIIIMVLHSSMYELMPRNTISACKKQCEDPNEKNCIDFCECIHTEGKSLEICLEEFKQATD